ncbi:hypothetical protein EYF80_000808 [Liparis tanakae]|uniref:Uncharacterized protein n=1 Tax=Liparis tanakae TaxID=230148 RepID=A0A4Z2JFI4_9TELE|nr:hypothetical protein EYF80_000808 [Liparis tanakae]
MASSSSSISSSATEGAGLWTESKESWDNMAAKSFLWCCCCSFSPLLFVSIFRLQRKAEEHTSVLARGTGGRSISEARGSKSSSSRPTHSPTTRGRTAEL